MKLLFCPDCWDVIKLALDVRQCACGRVKGKYTDNLHAVTNGEGVCLAFNNTTLSNAIAEYALTKDRKSRKGLGGVTQADTLYFQFSAWVRDHEGESNPHTSVDKTL